jgi:hypothetical protein
MKLRLVLLLACVSMYGQKYPGSIATDGDMLVAQNSIKVKLQSAVGVSDTTIVIAATPAGQAAILPNSVVSIDLEIMFVCAHTGNTLTIGTATACPSTGGRGYDGTTAAAHNLGPCSGSSFAGCVIGNVVAKHHNSMKDEIKAIEGALGPNLQNVNLSSPSKLSSSYAFPPQMPGGSLISGNSTITMTPVPLGLNGSDTGHYLYVSGGTGAAEACLITGGSGTAGSVSGQIILNCANAHTGAWMVGPASGGIAEAIVAAGTQGSVTIGCGSYNIYGTVTIPYQNMTVRGLGACSVIYPQVNGMTVFNVNAVPGFLNLDMGGLQIIALAPLPALNTIKAINIVSSAMYAIHDVLCIDVFYCLYLDRGGNPANVDRITLQGNSTLWAGSTTDSAGAFLLNAVFSNVGQYPTGRSTSLGLGSNNYYITLQRCITCTIRAFKTADLQNVTNGILFLNDNEGDTIDDATIVTPIDAIDLNRNTVGATAASPSWTKMTHLDIDRFSGTAVSLDNLALFNKVENSTITGAGAMVSGIHMKTGSYGTSIVGNTFQNLAAAMAVWIDANVSYVNINSNYFQAQNGVVGIIVSPGTSDYLAITGNVFDTRQGMVPCQINPALTKSAIASNVGTSSINTCP